MTAGSGNIGRFRVLLLMGCLTLGFVANVEAQTAPAPPRERTLVFVGRSDGSPTLSAPNNANWYGFGTDIRNGFQFVYEPLFTLNHLTGEHIPWLAERYQYNDDFTSVRVFIRKGVKWNDGEDFDAEDVAFTLNMLMENGRTKRDLTKAVEVATLVSRVTVEDKLTVKIDLFAPDPRYVYRQLTNYFGLGLHWVPRHIWKDVADKASFTFVDIAKGWPVGTGAWKVVKTSPTEIVLDRRADWWGASAGFRPLPAVERIVAIAAPDDERNAQLIINNQIDQTQAMASPSLVKSILDRNPKLTTFSGRKPPYGYLDYSSHSLYFNHMAEGSAFQDVRVRRAVMHAINRKQLIEFAWDGANTPNYTPFPAYQKLNTYVDSTKDIIQKYGVDIFDLALSAKLMGEAGYKKDSEGFWAKDGKRAGGPIEMQPQYASVGQVVAQQLKRAGFDAKFSSTPDSFRKFRVGQSIWHVFGHNGGSIFDPNDTLRMYTTKNKAPIGTMSFFVSRWSNPEFDAIFEKMEQLPIGDPGLIPLYREAMEIWYREAVEVPLEQAYHLQALNETYWTNWPSEQNPYAPACINCFISGWGALLAHHIKPVK